MIWQVLAKTGTNIPEFALAGEYYGIGADASLGAGAGAKVIAGGTNKAFMLQPLNVQAQEGLDLAIGVEKIDAGARCYLTKVGGDGKGSLRRAFFFGWHRLQ